MMEKVNIAIFVSGNGTNCENIIRYFQGSEQIRVALVVSNKADAYALVRARNLGVDTVVMPKKDLNDEQRLLPLLHRYSIRFIVLSGFLLLIPTFLVRAYDHRILNLHPALLPKFGGKGMYGHHVHEAVYAAHEYETGMTVHWVSEQCDGGEIIAQYKTPLLSTDTPARIAEKEHELEMAYFPVVIERVIRKTFDFIR